MDGKNRFIVPTDYRPPAGATELIIVRHPNEYLVALTGDQYDEVHRISLEKIQDLAERRDFTSLMSHIVRKVPIDRQFRITLTPQEIEHMGGSDRSIVVKTGSELSLFEVWSAKRHQESISALMREKGKQMVSKIGI
ncbi:MAG: hypothetical protein WCV00_02835 [Verrucomicrobiia bacterium]